MEVTFTPGQQTLLAKLAAGPQHPLLLDTKRRNRYLSL